MFNGENDDSNENTILYELLIYAEWPQDPEVQIKGTNDKLNEKYATGSYWNWLNYFTHQTCPPPAIRILNCQQIPWQFAVGGEGRVVAVLQDQYLEIRSSRDEYGSLLGRVVVTKDGFPQWRKLAWSPDCTLLALARSTGDVDVYDLIGAHLFTIPNTNNKNPQDFGECVAGLVFCDLRTKNTLWSYELLVANYRGDIRAFYVSPTDSYQASHEFSLAPYFSNGISAFLYHSASQLLFVSGMPMPLADSCTNKALQMGITAWRLLLGWPYYKLALSLEDEMLMQKSYWWVSYLHHWKNVMSPHCQDIVYRMSISPNQQTLAAVHTSGSLSLWNLPNLNLQKFWEMNLQPNYSDMNPQYCEPGMKRKAAAVVSNPIRYHLTDVNWWSDEALILARFCGSVSVSSVHSLKNLLGISPEWFEPYAQISASHDRGFLAMECESVITSKKRSSSEVYDSDNEDSSDDEELSFFTQAANLAKKAMFYVTDNERFRPPRKKMRFLNKTYRLLCLKSTTPEELFTRRLNNEEYGEALALAQTYNMDCDLVYQRQWRKNIASVATIQDYLSKITKRAWVLHECLERVPETIDAAKELLMYGLRGTDIQALISIGKGEDHGRFIAYQSFDEPLDDEYDEFSFNEEKMERRQCEMKEKKTKLLKQINFSKLSLEQRQLCECRLKLLIYLDRLTTYEAILGGPGIAEDFYNHNFFRKFRSQSGLEACISFARESNWQAIAAMFTYHGSETLHHHLPILSNFPETTSPIEYQLLLPKLGYSKTGPVICPWNEDEWRVSDWCENKYKKCSTTPISSDFVVEFYEESKQFLKYRDVLSPSVLTEWYIERAREIESESCMVENALDLVKLGMERNVQGLEKLLDTLKTLETLVYECQLVKDIALKELKEMDNFEVVRLLMSTTAKENFVANVKQRLLPFLNRCESQHSGSQKALLKRYLIDISKEDLYFCRNVIESSQKDHSNAIIPEVEEQAVIALDCIYVCEKCDNLKDICVILEHLSYQNQSSGKLASLYSQVAAVKKHLRVAELIEKNGSSVTLGFLRNCSQNKEEIVKLLTKLTRLAGRKSRPLSEANWLDLLHDITEIQKLFDPCITLEECYDIYLHSLLCSGRREAIDFAGKMMICSQKQKKQKVQDQNHSRFRLPFESSVSLVLKASQEFFNSSATLTDPCMNLAIACLNLIEDPPETIEEELDLIAALKLLQEFRVEILPLQVRMCVERLKLVKQALKNKPRAYRNSQKVLKLAYLLRVCGNNKKVREGKVLSLVAETAFEAKDFESCSLACTQIMEGSHEEGWLICDKLGRCKDFSNMSSRCDLMSFAVIHCPDDLLPGVLKAKLELELQGTYDRVKFLMGDNAGQNSEFDFLSDDINGDIAMCSNGDESALRQTSEMTMQVLQTTTKTTRAMLTSVKNTQLWKDAVKWIKPNELPWEDNSSGETTRNKDLLKQGMCAFYSGYDDNAHMSEFEANYQRYARPDLNQSLEISSKLFRASLLEETLNTEACKSGINIPVVIDLAKAYFPEDTLYSLSLLLGLKQFDEVEELLMKLPSTPVVLQFASLLYALQIHSRLEHFQVSLFDSDSLPEPSHIIQTVVDYMTSEESEKCKCDETIETAYGYLQKYNKLLYDFIQAELLHSIGGGVDAVRFTSDDVYKKETILGIAMTLDDRVYQTAVSLARHYKMPLWDVYMAHMEYLVSDSRLSTAAIEERVKSLKLLGILLEQPEKFRERLTKCVYPIIEGKDYGRLQWYFSVLALSGDDPDEWGVTPSTHIKLLSKFKQYKHLDYKHLMQGSKSPMAYLKSLLNKANVQMFAKAASKIPDGNGHFLTPSAVCCCWVTKYFFDGSASLKVPQSTSDWLHRYESCNDMLLRLLPADFLEFINSILFSETALERLNIDCRSEIINRAVKFCRQRSTKGKDSPEISPEWQNVFHQIQQYRNHLSRMSDPVLTELNSSADSKIGAYAKEFDLSRSVPEKLKQLLLKIVLDGPDLSLLTSFLACCPSDLDWTPADAYLEAVHLIIAKMRKKDTEYPDLVCKSPLDMLEKVLDDISIHRDELMIDDVAMDVVYEFCQDSTVAVQMRLKVLQLLEKTSYFSKEYSSLLLLYQTQAVVISIWPNYEVKEEEIQGELERKNLFDKLIPECSTYEHYCSLAELLCHWPCFTSDESTNSTLWTDVLCGLASCEDSKALDKTISFFEKAHSKHTLNFQCCKKIFQEVCKHGSIFHSLKFAFKTKHGELHNDAIALLKDSPELSSKKYDEELLRLMLEQRLVAEIVHTSLYKYVIEFLFDNEKDFSVQAVIEQLRNAGCEAEAGSLALINSHAHTGLSTFSAAVDFLKKSFKR